MSNDWRGDISYDRNYKGGEAATDAPKVSDAICAAAVEEAIVQATGHGDASVSAIVDAIKSNCPMAYLELVVWARKFLLDTHF